MANGNGTWIVRLAMGLATAGILGGVGVYAQVRVNSGDLEKAEKVHKETRDELKEIRETVNDVETSQARSEGKVNAIYDVIVKDKE